MSSTSISTASQDNSLVAQIWANAVIRQTVAEQADKQSLSRLARVSKEAFRAAIPPLWDYQEDLAKLRANLARVRKSTRYLDYCKAVKHIHSMKFTSQPLGPILLSHPALRSITDQTGRRCSWSIGSDGLVYAVLLVPSSILASDHKQDVNHIRSLFPDDWNVTYRTGSVTVKDDDCAEQLIEILSSSRPLQFSHMTLRPLARTVRAAAIEALASGGHRVSGIDFYPVDLSETGPKLHTRKENLLSEIRRLRVCTDTLNLRRVSPEAPALVSLASALRTFRKVSLTVDPWKNSFDFQGYALNHTKDHLAPLGRVALTDLHCNIRIRLKSHQVLTLGEALDKLDKDRIWHRNIARLLFTIGGPTVRYSIKLKIADANVVIDKSSATTFSNHRMNDIIATFIECRSETEPHGWRQLEVGERRQTDEAVVTAMVEWTRGVLA